MWDIYSIGDGEFLASVINAVGMLTGTGDFATLVRIGFGIGVLLIAMQGALSGGRGVHWQEAFIGLVIYLIMFGPQVRVNIEDMYSGQVYPVDNVPLGVAATGSILSRAGYSITTLFETAFGTPSMTEQSYGMSLKRLQAAREAVLNRINTGEANSPVPGSDVEKSWANYIQECALTAVNLHDQNPSVGLSLDHVLNGQLPEALHFTDNDYYFTEIYTGGAPQTLSCDQAYLQLESFTSSVFLPAAKQNIKAFMAPHSFLNTDQLLQNAMDGIEQYGINIDTYLKSVYLVPVYGDAVVQMHLGAKQNVMASIVNEAVQRRNAQWQAQKSVFETSVQPFITFMEALFYALTPIMGLVIGLGMMGIKMIGKYIVLALWIQMWMPVMAIVNHYIHAATAGKISAVMASVVAEPMSITGMAQWDGIIQNQLAVGGMLASSVPIIALFIVSGSYYALTNVAGQMTGQDHVDESKAAPSTPDPLKFGPMQTWDRERGQHGAEATSAMTTFSWSAQDAEQTASTQAAMQSASSNFSSMLGQRVSAMSGTSEKGGQSFSFGSGTRVGNSQSENMLKTQGQSLADRWTHSNDVTSAQIASFGAAAATGKQSTPELSATIRSQTTLSESESDQLANELQQTFKEDEGWNASFNQQVAKEFAQGSENIYTRGTGLSEDKQLQAAAQESYQATHSYSEAVTSGVTRGARQDVDGVKAGKNLAANDGGRERLESAITRAGFDGAVQEWMASASGQDTIRQMGGDAEAATSYAMLLTANGQNQYANNQQLSAPERGRLEDTANSALAETFGQVGAPAFGARASAYESAASGHTPQQGSVEGSVNNAVSGMRIPKAEQVRGNAGAGLADAQQSSRGPDDTAMRSDYSARTDHVRQASQGAFEDFKAEDEKLTRGDIESQNSRGSMSDTQTQGPHALSEFGSNIGDIGSAIAQAVTSDKGFYDIRREQMAEQYSAHYDYATEKGLTDEQATLYARTASLGAVEHRAVDWVGNHISPQLGVAMGWQREYQEQTATLAQKLDPEVSTSIQKAAYEGEGNNSGRLDRIASLNNPDRNFPERAGMSSPHTQGQAANSGVYSAEGDMARFMPPEPDFAAPQDDSSPSESQPVPQGGITQSSGGQAQDYGSNSPAASQSGPSASTLVDQPAAHQGGSTGLVDSPASSQPGGAFATPVANAAPAMSDQNRPANPGFTEMGHQSDGYASTPAPASVTAPQGTGAGFNDSLANGQPDGSATDSSDQTPAPSAPSSATNPDFINSSNTSGEYASLSNSGRPDLLANTNESSTLQQTGAEHASQPINASNGASVGGIRSSGEDSGSAPDSGAAPGSHAGQNLESSPSVNANTPPQATTISESGPEMPTASAGTRADEQSRSLMLEPIVIHGEVGGTQDTLALNDAAPASQSAENLRSTSGGQQNESRAASAATSGMTASPTTATPKPDLGFDGFAGRTNEAVPSLQTATEQTPQTLTEYQMAGSFAMHGRSDQDASSTTSEGYAGSSSGHHRSAGNPSTSESAQAATPDESTGFVDSFANRQPDAAFATPVANAAPAMSDQNSPANPGFTEMGTLSGEYASASTLALAAEPKGEGTGFVDPFPNDQPGESSSLAAGTREPVVSEPNSGTYSSLMDGPNVSSEYASIAEPGQPDLAANSSESSAPTQPTDSNMTWGMTGGYSTDSLAMNSAGEAPHGFNPTTGTSSDSNQSQHPSPALVADATPAFAASGGSESDSALASANENALASGLPEHSASMNSALDKEEAPAGDNWNDSPNTMAEGDSMLGLSDDADLTEALAQSRSASVSTQASDKACDEDEASQGSDWYTQAFASNQNTQAGQTDKARAFQDEQLRAQLLEPGSTDGGEAPTPSRTVGQDMGRA